MELIRSLPHSQVPATHPYPEPARSSPYPLSYFLKIRLNIILPSTSGSPKWFFPSGFPTKILYTPFIFPIRATCPAHLILLDFITRTIFGELHRSLSSSMQFPPLPCYRVFLGPKYSPQHRILKHSQVCVSPSMSATTFHTHTKEQTELQFCIFLHHNYNQCVCTNRNS